MTMMRRGPLESYPMDWVLRQAGAHRVTGSIEIHGPRPITVYLQDGRVSYAELGVGAGEPRRRAVTTALREVEARRHVVATLAAAVDTDRPSGSGGGWYYHDPLAVPLEAGPWRWEPAGLLMDARVWAHEQQALGSWVSTDLALDLGGAPAGVTLGPEAWAVVVALSATRSTDEVRGRLGWSAERLVAALGELGAEGALRPRVDRDPVVVAAGEPAADLGRCDAAGAAAAVAAAEELLAVPPPQPTRWPGSDGDRPLVPTRPGPGAAPAPPAVDERRGALRRLIDSLRPA